MTVVGHNQCLRKRPLPEIDELRERFVYVPETGHLWRRQKFLSKLCCAVTYDGYLAVGIVGVGTRCVLLGHRVAFAMMCGYWPDVVDHINGIRDDNRWCNLRATDQASNSRNRFLQADRSVVRSGSGTSWLVQFRERTVCFTLWRDAENFRLYLERGQAHLGGAFVPVIPSRSERIKPGLRKALGAASGDSLALWGVTSLKCKDASESGA